MKRSQPERGFEPGGGLRPQASGHFIVMLDLGLPLDPFQEGCMKAELIDFQGTVQAAAGTLRSWTRAWKTLVGWGGRGL